MPGLVLAGLMLRAPGMLLSSVIRQPETFAGVMNFVIFPMSFALVRCVLVATDLRRVGGAQRNPRFAVAQVVVANRAFDRVAVRLRTWVALRSTHATSDCDWPPRQ